MPNKLKSMGQMKYFYSPMWRKDQDKTFIHMLAEQGRKGHKQINPKRPNRTSLDYAMGAVDIWSGKKIQESTYLKKLEMLRFRYNTFKRILADPASAWNPRTNRIIAGKEDWRRLRKECSFAKAYVYRGEPMWKHLRVIFKLPDGDGESSEEVSVSKMDGEPADAESETEHESDVVVIGDNMRDKPEVVDLCSSDDGNAL